MPVGTSLEEVQIAILKKLKPGGTLDSTLSGLGVTGIFDILAVPTGQAFRYITLGDNLTETAMDSFSHLGYDATFVLNLWAQDATHKYLYQILGRCNQLLHKQTLTFTNLSQAGIWYQGSETMPKEEDGKTIRLIPRYRIITTEAR